MTVKELIKETGYTEESGEIVSAQRVFVVTGVSGTAIGDILFAACEASGIPKPGDALSESARYTRVRRRRPTIIGKKSGLWHVRVDVEYELQRLVGSEGDRELDQLALRGGSSVTQIATMKDRQGNALKVTYTPTGGTAQQQQGELNVYDVQATFMREAVRQESNPEDYISNYINCVNADSFRGKPAKYWLCTNISYELINRLASPALYRFVFEFQGRPELWKYTYVYRDQTGQVPNDVAVTQENGNGIVTIEWHEQRNFSAIWSA